MYKSFWIVLILLLSTAQSLSASEPESVVISHYESLEDLSFGRSQFDRSPESRVAEPVSMAFHALGRRFVFELEANERLLTQAFKGRVPDDVGVYRGRLAGHADSWVRLVISNNVPSGLVWDGEQMFAIEPHHGVPGSNAPIIYRLRDVYVEPGMMSCGNTSAHAIDFATVYEEISAELNEAIAETAVVFEELNIGVVGDFEFSHVLGATAEAELIARINNVDGIFSEQLGVQITAREVDTFLGVDDPFTSSNPSVLLDEISSYRQSTPAQAEQGITYLFTGRDLDGTSVGLAYRGALCAERFGVGLGEARRGAAIDSLIAAHEIGHLFGAEHDSELGSVCESVTGTFLMSPTVSDTSEFSSCSIETMQPYIDAASCINPLPEADVSVEVASGTESLFLGDSVNLYFDVVNNGTLDATNTALSLDIPPNLTLDSITASTGSCSSGAGQADCALGAVAGLGSERVTVGVTASTEGASALSVAATADNDSDSGNNAQIVQIVVAVATDLAVRVASAASVMVDDTVSINPTVENLSPIDATNVILSVSFSNGLQVASASWPDGTCTVTASTVECQRASLAGQSQVALDIQLTATASGSQSYTAAISSSEADRDESNNNSTATVTVSAVSGGAAGDSDRGGGAVTLLWLLLAAFLRLQLNRNP